MGIYLQSIFFSIMVTSKITTDLFPSNWQLCGHEADDDTGLLTLESTDSDLIPEASSPSKP